MKKRIWSLLLCAALLLTLAAVLPGKAQAATTLAKDSDGYYLIGNEDELFAFSALVNGGEYGANGKLTENITMTGETKPWTPIGNTEENAKAYTGIFDGQGHTISNLYFNDTTVFNAGLFGYVRGGTIRNVIIADGYIAAIWGGAIAGKCLGSGRIEGCGNLNTTVAGDSLGGIVGDTSCPIIACWNTGKISGSSWVGGICASQSGSVKGCWNTGEISGERCGGIVGVTNYVPTIAYCYNDGKVVATNEDFGGAIVGADNGSGKPNM